MRWPIVLLIFFASTTQGAAAQALPSPPDEGFTRRFQLRVKQLDQFIDRFNNADEELHRLYRSESVRQQDPAREAVLRTLAAPQLDAQRVERFIQHVSGAPPHGPVYLSQRDPDWYAEAFCEVTYRGQTERLELVLRKEIDPARGSRWVVAGAQADFLNLSYRDSTRLINPMSHATNFTDLYRAFEDHGNALVYAPHGYKPDKLSVLLHLMDRGELVFHGVQRLSFHFLQIDGWVVRVEELNASDHPGGWVISDLVETKPEEKDAYRRQVLHLN